MQASTFIRLCPTKEVRNKKINTDFQNKYRKEINEIISGTEYLNQMIPKNRNSVKEIKKDNYNLNKLTPQAKRELMFQKPVTMVKRQSNYYIAKKNTLKHSTTLKNNENNEILENEKNNIQENEDISYKLEQEKKNYNQKLKQIEKIHQNKKSNNVKKQESISPKSSVKQSFKVKRVKETIHKKSPNTVTHRKAKKITSIPNPVNEIDSENNIIDNYYEYENNDHSESDFEFQEKAINNNENDHNQTHQEECDDIKSNTTSKHVKIKNSASKETINNDLKEPYTPSEFHNEEEDSHSSSYNIYNTNYNNSVKMVSSDAIDMEVDFSSDSSSGYDLQSQFFVQEPVDNSRRSFGGSENFISSGAIESLSDDIL